MSAVFAVCGKISHCKPFIVWQLRNFYMAWSCRAAILLTLVISLPVSSIRSLFYFILLANGLIEENPPVKIPSGFGELGILSLPPRLSHQIQNTSFLLYSNLTSCIRNLFVEYDQLILVVKALVTYA